MFDLDAALLSDLTDLLSLILIQAGYTGFKGRESRTRKKYMYCLWLPYFLKQILRYFKILTEVWLLLICRKSCGLAFFFFLYILNLLELSTLCHLQFYLFKKISEFYQNLLFWHLTLKKTNKQTFRLFHETQNFFYKK